VSHIHRFALHAGGILLAAATLGAGMTTSLPALAATVQAKSAHHDMKNMSTYPMTVKDDTGRTIVLKKQPVRIVSLTLGTDEVLTSMIPAKDLVGIDYYSTVPTYSHIVSLVAREHLHVIGSASGSINAEEVIAQRPDLVLAADYTNPKVVAQLEAAGIPVYEFTTFNSFAAIESHILTLGKIVNEQAKAAAMVAHIRAQLAALAATQPKTRLTVLYYSFGYVAGAETTGNDVIQDAGGINAAAKFTGWPAVSAEQVVKLNPDVIVIPDDSGAQDAELKSFLANSAFKDLKAVKDHHVYTAPDGNLSDVAQFFPLGVADVQHMLAEALHTK